ncbi:hypothetical protein BDV29DRAFT_11622 [Aspergillus leporis]|uniref:Uncharacterized protein n=1 Tax=Aspergillus leporis TaxID=41062 RepID=A0A5N5WTH3_9EURO|nr:hypothetical protein BDV29DRAFT_11622 [Aspergillus leporis]
MVFGIIFQLASLCSFTIFFQWVMFRAISQILRGPPLRYLCIVVNLSILVLLIRGVFRSIELLQWWRGYIFTHEIYTIVLDEVMVFFRSWYSTFLTLLLFLPILARNICRLPGVGSVWSGRRRWFEVNSRKDGLLSVLGCAH